MQYPSDWRVEGTSNPSIIASFYPQGDNASNVIVIVVVQNLTANYTPDQYLNSLIRADEADNKDFPDLTIKALGGTKFHPYTLPIVANFSIPTEAKSITSTQANTLTTQSASGSNTFTDQSSILTVIVQPPFTIPEQLSNFVTSWITPISGLWSFLAGVAAVTAPLIIRSKTKKSKETKGTAST